MIKRLFVSVVISLIILLNIIPMISAGALGISPASFKIDFEPNLEQTFNFKIMTGDPEQEIEVYVKGDLAEYVNLSTTHFKGNGGVTVILKLPAYIAIPGTHRILIGAIEVNKELDGMIGGIVAIQAPIDVKVPYPGKYAEASFNVMNVNEGEKAKFDLRINNLGTELISVTPQIDIFEGSYDNRIQTKILQEEEINSKEQRQILGFLETSTFEAGTYPVKAFLDYGKLIELESLFRVGSLFMNITNYTYKFETGKINKFDIEVENLWNLEMKEVYAYVSITDAGNVLDTFTTASMNMAPWEKKTLTGFFDATNIKPGKYIASLKLFYGGTSANKLVAIYVEDPEKEVDWMLVGIVGGAIIILLALFGVVLYLIKEIKNLKSNEKIQKKSKKKK